MDRSNLNKKLKVAGGNNFVGGAGSISDSDCNDFLQVREYILKCPFVSSIDHPAIVGALKGLENEEKRHLRGVKLRQLFSEGTKCDSKATDVETKISETSLSSKTASDDEPVLVSHEFDFKCRNRMTGSGGNFGIEGTVVATAGESKGSDSLDELDGDWHDVDSRVDAIGCFDTSDTMNGSHEDVRLDTHDGISPLGRLITPTVVSLLASNNVTVQSPLGAIAIALHATLVSPIIRFICTGSPDTDQNSVKGFAAPIRDIPKTQFILPSWEDTVTSSSQTSSSSVTNIRIRYRKDGVGSIILLTVSAITNKSLTSTMVNTTSNSLSFTKNMRTAVSEEMSTTIKVALVANPKNDTKDEEPATMMQFLLDEHLNTISWTKAVSNLGSASRTSQKLSGCISPSLHYKQLSKMISTFVQTFDFGTVYDKDDIGYVSCSVNAGVRNTDNARNTILSNDLEQPYMDKTISNLPTRRQPTRLPVDPLHVPNRHYMTSDDKTSRTFGVGKGIGDFDGDVLPRNLQPSSGNCSIRDPFDPLGIVQQPSNMGNLLGPNHPMFASDSSSQRMMQPPNYQNDPALRGFGGMRARFDPYGPPPTDIRNFDDMNGLDDSMTGGINRGRMCPPGINYGPGNGLQPPGFGPNPDHLRMPNPPKNNMFM